MSGAFFNGIKAFFIVLIIGTLFACTLLTDEISLDSGNINNKLLTVRQASYHINVGLNDSLRSVNLRVSYPVGSGRYPLIVFSHGHALDNQSYYNLTDYWVKRGFVVVAPLHLDSGGDLAAMSVIAEQYGGDWITVSRLLDMTAVIDQINDIVSSLDGFDGEVLTDKVIAAGHSYGALSSQQLSGAHLELRGDSIYPVSTSYVDERIVAVVAISPPGLIKGSLSEKTWEGYSMPQLVVTGPNDFFPYVWPNYEDHFISYLTAEEGDNYLLVLDGMDHYLGNLIGRLERDGPAQTLALKNLSEISMLFIEHFLSLEGSLDSHNKTLLVDNISKRDGVLQYEYR